MSTGARPRARGAQPVRLARAALIMGMGFGAARAQETVPATPASEPIETRARTSIRRGLDWLKGMQKEDGSWSNPNYPALTALGLWAFARSEHPDRGPVCARAAGFIERFVQPDGAIYKPAGAGRGSGGLSTYNTAICMIALHAYDPVRHLPAILRARRFVAESQLLGDSPESGGFGYDRNPPLAFKVVGALTGRGTRGDLSNTGWSLQAMRETQDVEDRRPSGKVVDVNWQAALRFVERLQSQDADDPQNYGSFGYERGGSRGRTAVDPKTGTVRLRGYGSMTYAGLESMIYAQVDRSDPRVRSALGWAARHWSVEENPGMGTRGLFYYYTIMAKSLSLNRSDTLARPDGGLIRWKQDLITHLAAIQRPDGSWINTDNSFWEGDATLVTAYAILTLEYVLGL